MWPKNLGFTLKVVEKDTFRQLESDPIRLNLRKHIPFQCGEEIPGSLGEDKSGVSETTSESADVTWQEKSHGP